MEYSARRNTMAPHADPYNNARNSQLPVPSTVKKPPRPGRMSMSGPAQRAPYPAPPASNSRQSMMRSHNFNPLAQSASKPQPYGRTPMRNTNGNRRNTGWPVGSHPAPTSNQTKDARPTRDKAHQLKTRQEIVAYFKNYLEKDIPMSMLQNITSKDFREVFQQLITSLDPQWPFEQDLRFEEHFMRALRAMQYPYVSQIDIKWLPTPAAMHSWPALLGVLHWLAELGKARHVYMNSQHPTLQNPELVPEEFDDDEHHLALAFQHKCVAYEVFLQGQDVFPEQEKILEQRYARKDTGVLTDLKNRRKHLDEIQTEWESLRKSAPPFEDLKKDNGSLRRDKLKFEEILRRFEERKQKWQRQVQDEKTELEYNRAQLETLHAEEERLASIVKVQNLSPEEVLRMNTEHENLSREIQSLKQKIAESSQSVVKLEVSLTRKDIDLTIDLRSAASNPQDLLTGADVRKVVKPTLNRIAEMKRTTCADVESDRIKVDDELDQLIARVHNKTSALNDQADELREAAQQEALISNAEASRLERDLAAARTARWPTALQIAYREQIDKVNRLKEDTVRAVIKNSSDVVAFKDEVSKQLQYLKDFSEAN
ncbi:HEC/Ndc80p family-domain-containing protein [Epithele typhae]|uniref:HEC/Ndc80p family-domain-containing protein n=1 Tax=Epithele typhae TaxID=378194 RepID=UPI00200743C8|nr:HEC/Ndc80p family-domain-containing protein [Epithele typhae]KAH9946289.1 HEC/Ndc80p family-domain-containing protein [Epithele typhae]